MYGGMLLKDRAKRNVELRTQVAPGGTTEQMPPRSH